VSGHGGEIAEAEASRTRGHWNMAHGHGARLLHEDG